MSGDYDSVIGMGKEAAAIRFWRKMPGERLAPAEGEATVCGVFVETDDATGLARRIDLCGSGGVWRKRSLSPKRRLKRGRLPYVPRKRSQKTQIRAPLAGRNPRCRITARMRRSDRPA